MRVVYRSYGPCNVLSRGEYSFVKFDSQDLLYIYVVVPDSFVNCIVILTFPLAQRVCCDMHIELGKRPRIDIMPTLVKVLDLHSAGPEALQLVTMTELPDNNPL